MTTRVVLASVLALTVGVVVLPAGQAPPQRPQAPVFRSNTELVEIDVVVVDKSGQPVQGLTRDDFILRDRRVPQNIDTFVEVQARP